MITILDVAIARGAKADTEGYIDGEEFARVGLSIIGGCAWCGATIAAYNALPTKLRYWGCVDCASHQGFETVAEFEEFEAECNEGN